MYVFFLAKDGLECAQANVFRVTDTRGEILFSADRSKVIVGAQELHVTGNKTYKERLLKNSTVNRGVE